MPRTPEIGCQKAYGKRMANVWQTYGSLPYTVPCTVPYTVPRTRARDVSSC